MIRWMLLGAALSLAACQGEPPSRIGSVCTNHDDCEPDHGEYCSRVFICVRSCAESPCPAGSRCVQTETRAVCLKECWGPGDCHNLERCTGDYGQTSSTTWRVCALQNPLSVEGPWSYE